MTEAEEALRASLRDPSLDSGISANALLGGVRARQQVLHRRRQHLKVAAAAVVAVLVIGGTTLLAARPAEVQPADQPSAPRTTAPLQPVLPSPAPSPPTLPAPTKLPTPSTTTSSAPDRPPLPEPSTLEPRPYPVRTTAARVPPEPTVRAPVRSPQQVVTQ